MVVNGSLGGTWVAVDMVKSPLAYAWEFSALRVKNEMYLSSRHFSLSALFFLQQLLFIF